MTDMNAGGLGRNISRPPSHRTDNAKPTGNCPDCADATEATVEAKGTDLYGAGAISGRSLVQKIKDDTFYRDMELLAKLYKEHPALVDKLDDYFDELTKYHNKDGSEHAYGRASRDLRLLVDELTSK